MMKNKFEWLNHFKIQQDKIVEIQRGLSSKESLLHVCIEQGLLNESEYIKWAKNFYKIPALKASFFDQPAPQDFINQYASLFPKYTLPVLDNEGTFFVACLEPVEDFKFDKPLQWVLAPYSKMKNWLPVEEPVVSLDLEIDSFDTLKKANGSKPAVQEPVAQEPVVQEPKITPPTKPAPVANDDGMLDFTNMDLGETKIGIIPEDSKSENPFEIKLDPQTDDSFSQSFSMIAPVDAPKEVNEPVVPEAPAGLSLNLDTPLDSPIEAPSLTTIEPTPTAVEAPPGLNINFNPEDVKINFGEAPKMPEIPIAVPQSLKSSSPSPSLSAKMLRDDVVNQTISVTPPPPPKEELNDLPELDHSEVSQQTLNKDSAETAFSQMTAFFNQCMILLFEDQKLKPWKFDSTWSKAIHMSDYIDLSTPSIFRIVTETRKSYHGHVIQNPINDAFFNTWNKGIYPEHITMSPLLVQNKLVGMLLGGTTKEKAKSIKLETVERIATQLASELQVSKKVA